jgi:DNA-binding transcriptional regulator YiaG
METNLYRYKGCGLDNVYLQNGYAINTLRSGEEVVSIEDIEGLHCAIASAIVDSASALDARTFKYLRKELDMSQRQVAQMFDVDEQTVSLWERARNPVPQHADLMLRTLVKEKMSGNAELRNLIQRFNSIDRDIRAAEAKIEMHKDQGGSWIQQAA